MILTLTAAAAIIWAALTVVTYLGILTHVFYILPFALRNILTTLLYFGIFGAPALGVLSAILYYVFSFITKSRDIISPRLRACALVLPLLLIGIMMIYEMNFGGVLH